MLFLDNECTVHLSPAWPLYERIPLIIQMNLGIPVPGIKSKDSCTLFAGMYFWTLF